MAGLERLAEQVFHKPAIFNFSPKGKFVCIFVYIIMHTY